MKLFIVNQHDEKAWERHEDVVEPDGAITINVETEPVEESNVFFAWDVLQHVDILRPEDVRELKKDELQELCDKLGVDYEPDDTKKDLYGELGIKSKSKSKSSDGDDD